jgi:mannose-1-phosphate guanylyltransferase
LTKIKTAVVLAGGEGLRLRPLTDDRPKVMIPVAGKPILGWVVDWLRRNELSKIVVGVAYKGHAVVEYLRNSVRGVDLCFSEHTVEGGTGQGFRLAIERYVEDENFLAMNGDELTDMQISQFADFHLRNEGLATIAVSPLYSPFGVVEMDGDTITGFREKAALEPYYVSIGIYMFNRELVDLLPHAGNIETETFPKLASRGSLKAFRHKGFWGTINTIKDLQEVERKLSAGQEAKP